MSGIKELERRGGRWLQTPKGAIHSRAASKNLVQTYHSLNGCCVGHSCACMCVCTHFVGYMDAHVTVLCQSIIRECFCYTSV